MTERINKEAKWQAEPEPAAERREGVLKYGWGWDGFKLAPGEQMHVREVLPGDPDPAAVAELIAAAESSLSAWQLLYEYEGSKSDSILERINELSAALKAVTDE